ncbi:hypothetical protein EDM68_01435 [Candidatus Uhrbacteria bacterium]|nr:MAG: hypothetical protein EDM68_01435 [Candidatus Uhrbacteria bacterium]
MRNIWNVIGLCVLVGCTAQEAETDGGRFDDAAHASDASMPDTGIDAGTALDAGWTDGGLADAVVDAYVPPPCSPDLSGQPGELLCTGLRATSADVIEASADIGRDERMPLLAFEYDGDIYLQTPLRVRRTCGGATGIMENGEPWTGSIPVEMVVAGVSTSLMIDVEPLVVAETGGGDLVRTAFERLRDEYAAVSDEEAAMNFEAARLGVESAQMTGVPVFGFGSDGCIPYSNCDCGPAMMTATNLAAVDAFLANGWNGLTALELPPGAGGGTDRLARCESSSAAALRCAMGFAAIAILADRPTDSFLAAAGAAIYTATAFTLPGERLIASAAGSARYYAGQLAFLAGQASALRRTTTRTLTDLPGAVMNRVFGTTGFSEDEIACGDCRTPMPSGEELAAAGCPTGACVIWADCGCTSAFACRGFVAGGGYCGACVESSSGSPICIPPRCVYENTWIEMPVECPGRCTSDMTPACR